MYDTRTPPANAARRLPPSASSPLRSSPAVLLGRVAALQSKPLPHRTPADTAMLEAFDLARAYPGELAFLLTGIRAGLFAAGVGRQAA